MRRCCANCGWLEVNPSGAMFCGYSDERTWEDESCMAWKDKDEPKTNADRIRSMSDEELAMWINNITTNALSVLALGSDRQTKSISYWLDWLKQGVE